MSPPSSYRDGEARAPVADERDISAQVPAGAAVNGALGLAQVLEVNNYYSSLA